MKSHEIVNKIHSGFLFYLLFGGFIISQRNFLVFLIPSLQYQYLINNEKCILTQLEEKLINNKKEKKEEVILEPFINIKLKEYNINIKPEIREKALHTILYCLFMGNYLMM